MGSNYAYPEHTMYRPRGKRKGGKKKWKENEERNEEMINGETWKRGRKIAREMEDKD